MQNAATILRRHSQNDHVLSTKLAETEKRMCILGISRGKKLIDYLLRAKHHLRFCSISSSYQQLFLLPSPSRPLPFPLELEMSPMWAEHVKRASPPGRRAQGIYRGKETGGVGSGSGRGNDLGDLERDESSRSFCNSLSSESIRVIILWHMVGWVGERV